MPLKNIFKKKPGAAFKKKRTALGVEREYNDSRTKRVSSMQGEADPKIRKLQQKLSDDRIILRDKINKLISTKPKDRLESKIKLEKIKVLKEKLVTLAINYTSEVQKLKHTRNIFRTERQNDILQRQLFEIANATNYSWERPIDSLAYQKILRSKYADFININKINFNKLTKQDAKYIISLADKAYQAQQKK